MWSAYQIENKLKTLCTKISAISVITTSSTIGKSFIQDQMRDLTIDNVPITWDSQDMITQLMQTPLLLGAESFKVETMVDDVIMLRNDFNRNLIRAALVIWPEQRTIIIVAVTRAQRNQKYTEVLEDLLNELKQEKVTQENSVFLPQGQTAKFIQKITTKRQNQFQLLIGSSVFEDIELQKVMDSPSGFCLAHKLREIHALCQSFSKLHTVFLIKNLNSENLPKFQQRFYYFDKINVAEADNQLAFFNFDSANDQDQNRSQVQTRLRFAIRNPMGEITFETQQHLEYVEFMDLLTKKLVELFVEAPYLTSASYEQQNSLDCRDDKKIGIQGYSLGVVGYQAGKAVPASVNVKYNDKQFVVIANLEENTDFAKMAAQCITLQNNNKQIFLLCSVNNFEGKVPNPQALFPNIHKLNLLEPLPQFFYEKKFWTGIQQKQQIGIRLKKGYIKPYTFGFVDHLGAMQFTNSLTTVTNAYNHYINNMKTSANETQSELELEEPRNPEVQIPDQESIIFRGFRFKYLQKVQIMKQRQFLAVAYLDTEKPDFEYQLENLYVFQTLAPEFYVVAIIRGLSAEVYLKQVQQKSCFLKYINVMLYKSGFSKFVRGYQKSLNSFIQLYDMKFSPYIDNVYVDAQRMLSETNIRDETNLPISYVRDNYHSILSKFLGKTIAAKSRKEPKLFLPQVRNQLSFGFHGGIITQLKRAKPYLRQALVALFMIDNRNCEKSQRYLLDVLNQAIDMQKSGNVFVLVCMRNITNFNMADFLLDEHYGKALSQLNIVADFNLFNKVEEVMRTYSQEYQLHNNYCVKKNIDKLYELSSTYANRRTEEVYSNMDYFYLIDQQASEKQITFYHSYEELLINVLRSPSKGAFLQDAQDIVEQCVYEDRVFVYQQKFGVRSNDQYPVYIIVNTETSSSCNLSKIYALQQKYENSLWFDVCLSGQKEVSKNLLDRNYYLQFLNVVSDSLDTGLNRSDLAFYYYSPQGERVCAGVGLEQLEEVHCKTIRQKYDPIVVKKIDSMGDKFIVQDGIYHQYLRKMYIRSPQKIFAIFYLDPNNDNHKAVLKQILELSWNYNELYPTIMLKGIKTQEQFNNFLVQKTSSGQYHNKDLYSFNVLADNMDQAGKRVGPTTVCHIDFYWKEDQYVALSDIAKVEPLLLTKLPKRPVFQRAKEVVYINKQQHANYISSTVLYHQHRRQFQVVCLLPNNEDLAYVAYECFRLQRTYPEYYFVYAIEMMDTAKLTEFQNRISCFDQLIFIDGSCQPVLKAMRDENGQYRQQFYVFNNIDIISQQDTLTLSKKIEQRDLQKRIYKDLNALEQNLAFGQRDRFQYRVPQHPVCSVKGRYLNYNGFNIFIYNNAPEYQKGQIIFLYYISLKLADVKGGNKTIANKFEDEEKIKGLARLEELQKLNLDVYLVVLFEHATPDVIKKVIIDNPILSVFNVGQSVLPEQRCCQINCCEIFEPRGKIVYFDESQLSSELQTYLQNVKKLPPLQIDSDNELNYEVDLKDVSADMNQQQRDIDFDFIIKQNEKTPSLKKFCGIKFRNRLLQFIQAPPMFVGSGSFPYNFAMFVYFDKAFDQQYLEYNLQLIFSLMKAHPQTQFIVCIRGITNTILINKLYSSCIYIKNVNIVGYRSGFSKIFSPIERKRPIRAFAFQLKSNMQEMEITPESLISILKQEPQESIQNILLDYPQENNIAVYGQRHLLFQKITPYEKQRFILVIYMNADSDVVVNNCRLAKELLDERDDVYLMICVNGIRENDARIKGAWNGILQQFNLISDFNEACTKAKSYLNLDYQLYEQQIDKDNEQISEQNREIQRKFEESQKELKASGKKGVELPQPNYNPLIQKIPFRSFGFIYDVKQKEKRNPIFQVPRIREFNIQFGLSQKQYESEIKKIPNSSIVHEGITFHYLQKVRFNTRVLKHILMYVDHNSSTFGNDLQNFFALQQKYEDYNFEVCIAGVTQISPEIKTKSYFLNRINIVADVLTANISKAPQSFWITPVNDPSNPKARSDRGITTLIAALSDNANKDSKGKTEEMEMVDATGDKSLMFRGVLYPYLRRIDTTINHFQSIFVFLKDSDRLESQVKTLYDFFSKYDSWNILVWVQGLTKDKLDVYLGKYPTLHNVNILFDKTDLVRNYTERSSSDFVAMNYKGVQSDQATTSEITKLDILLQNLIQAKATPLNAQKVFDPNVVVMNAEVSVLKKDGKTVEDKPKVQRIEYKLIQKVYNRRYNQQTLIIFISNPTNIGTGDARNLKENQFDCEKFLYYTYQMQVRYPEIYFVYCIEHIDSNNVNYLQNRFLYFDRLNIMENPVDVVGGNRPMFADFLSDRYCLAKDQDDPKDQNAPKEQHHYQYYYLHPQFNDLSKKSDPIKKDYQVMEVTGTPQDEIMQKLIIDTYSSREYLAYLSPHIDLRFGEVVGFGGYQMKFLNHVSQLNSIQNTAFIYLRQTINNFDQQIKTIIETKQKLDFQIVFAIAGVSSQNIKAFLQQKVICKNINIVEVPPFVNQLFHSFKMENELSDQTTTVDDLFCAAIQTNNFDFKNMDNIMGEEIMEDRLQKDQSKRIHHFLKVMHETHLTIVNSARAVEDPLNLDFTGEKIKPGEKRNIEKQQLVVQSKATGAKENAIIFRAIKFDILQSATKLSELVNASRSRYCFVFVPERDIQERKSPEELLMHVAELQDSYKDVTFFVVIDQVSDLMKLYQYQQKAHYISALNVLQYKQGLNAQLIGENQVLLANPDADISMLSLFNAEEEQRFFSFSQAQEISAGVRSFQIEKNEQTWCQLYDQIQQRQSPLQVQYPNGKYIVHNGSLQKIINTGRFFPAQRGDLSDTDKESVLLDNHRYLMFIYVKFDIALIQKIIQSPLFEGLKETIPVFCIQTLNDDNYLCMDTQITGFSEKYLIVSDQFENVKSTFYRYSSTQFEYTDALYLTYSVGSKHDVAGRLGMNCALLRCAPVIDENLTDLLQTNAQSDIKNIFWKDPKPMQ